MTEQKFAIIIDDNPNQSQIDNIKNDFVARRINFNYEILNPTEYTIDDQGNVDIDEVWESLFSERYLKRTVDIIVCDYHLGLKNLNGFQMIRNIRNRTGGRSIPTILYSANLEDVIGDIVNDPNELESGNNIAHVIKSIKVLVDMKLDGFSKKENLQEGLNRFFNKNLFVLETELENQLQKYKNWTFRSTYPPLANRPISDVLDQIRLKSNDGIGFQKALLEAAIAQMIDMNSEINPAKKNV